MIFEVLKGCSSVFKSSSVAKLAGALNLLENWEKNSENAHSPEAFESNNVQWVKRCTHEYFLFRDKLSSSKALSQEEQGNSKNASLTCIGWFTTVHNSNESNNKHTQDDSKEGDPVMSILLFAKELDCHESCDDNNDASHHLVDTSSSHGKSNEHQRRSTNIKQSWNSDPHWVQRWSALSWSWVT